ncbi:hypothetical protein BJ138DRAFT_979514, partial [Hygrophoropsis aurantiaca]
MSLINYSSKNASIKHADATKPPILTAGILTPEIARAWENSCLQFFQQKDVAEDKQVQRVAWGMRDARLSDWYLTNKAQIDGSTFAEYMTLLRTKWLEANWQARIRQRLLSSRQNHRPFYEWAVELQSINAILRDDLAHLSIAQLRFQLEANMNSSLHNECEHEKASDEPDFDDWIDLVKRIDEKRVRRMHEHQQAIEAYVRSSGAKSFSTSRTTTNSSSTSSNVLAAAPHITFVRLPPLTDQERQLLKDHRGCFKCRHFYVNHLSTSCPDGFPAGEGYKTLTERDALAAKPRKSAKPVVSVTIDTVASVSMPSAVLGDGTDSDE